MRAAAWLDEFISNVRFASRQLASSPGFVCVAVLTFLRSE